MTLDINVKFNSKPTFINIVYAYSQLFWLNFDFLSKIYSERQKYGINSLKIKQIFFQKNLWTGQF
jgi:hypothetical protein